MNILSELALLALRAAHDDSSTLLQKPAGWVALDYAESSPKTTAIPSAAAHELCDRGLIIGYAEGSSTRWFATSDGAAVLRS